jgi:hypothetical protein
MFVAIYKLKTLENLAILSLAFQNVADAWFKVLSFFFSMCQLILKIL